MLMLVIVVVEPIKNGEYVDNNNKTYIQPEGLNDREIVVWTLSCWCARGSGILCL